jgi:ribose 1,5-bisphosphokinase
VLAARLRLRGREDEAEIAQRLRRAAEPVGAGCLTLNNDGEFSQMLQDFLRLLAE